MESSREKLLEGLKRFQPSKVRAFAGDDDATARDIAVPTRRKKWSQVVEAVEAKSWTRVELLNKAGEVMGYVDNNSVARELEDVTASPSGGQMLLAERIVQMVIRAQRETLTYQSAETTALLKAQGDVVRELVTGMRALTELHRETVDAAEAAAELRAQAAAGPDSEVKQLLEAAPLLLQAAPLLKQMLGGSGNKT